MYAERISTDTPQESQDSIYSTVTNSQGEFDLQQLYYGGEGTFRISVEKGDHGFDPESREAAML